MELTEIAVPDGAEACGDWDDDGRGVHRRRIALADWPGQDHLVEVATLQVAKYDDSPQRIHEHRLASPYVVVWTGEMSEPSFTFDGAAQAQLLAQQVAQAADTISRFEYFDIDWECLVSLADDLLKAANYMSDYAKWEH